MFSVDVLRNRRIPLLVFGIVTAAVCMALGLANAPMADAGNIFGYNRLEKPLGINLEPRNGIIYSRHYVSRDGERARLYTMNPAHLVELITIEDRDKH